MTLPASGAISFNAINVELGVAGTTTANINQATYRTLAGVPSGTIALSNFYGKANQFAFTISSNQTTANLRSLAVTAGWNGTSAVVATINAGVVIYGSPGLTINGSFPGGVTLTNNGYITGVGGTGGAGGTPAGPYGGTAGSAGSQALAVSVPVTIQNNNIIGGGGGGGGGSSIKGGTKQEYEGSGGGGGASYGTGGPRGFWPGQIQGQPGNPGGLTTGGTGGLNNYVYGGTGGSLGASGSQGGTAFVPGAAGGSAGACITGNSLITWTAFGTRYGSIS